jgi:hypothetical protein
LGFENASAVHASLLIEEVHIAMLATFADLNAAVPWVPNIVHNYLKLYCKFTILFVDMQVITAYILVQTKYT